jgi:hypothetical protein
MGLGPVRRARMLREIRFDDLATTAFGPDFFDVFATNAIGVVRVTQAALPLLHKSDNPVGDVLLVDLSRM